MAYDLDEQEQIDQMKAFWAKWGNLIQWAAIAIALAFAAFYGYKYYQRSQAQQAVPVFEQLEKAIAAPATDAKKMQLVKDLATKLTTDHAGSSYAQMGALLAAKALVEGKASKDAQPLLQWAVDKSKDPEYSLLARLRLAGLYLDEKKIAEATALLSAPVPKAFEALFADRRGDVLAASDKKTEAGAEYQKAWTGLEENSQLRDVIEQKALLVGIAIVKPAKVDKADNSK